MYNKVVKEDNLPYARSFKTPVMGQSSLPCLWFIVSHLISHNADTLSPCSQQQHPSPDIYIIQLIKIYWTFFASLRSRLLFTASGPDSVSIM